MEFMYKKKYTRLCCTRNENIEIAKFWFLYLLGFAFVIKEKKIIGNLN